MVISTENGDAMTGLRDVPTVWVLHDGKAGMASQTIGLAEALGWPFVEKRLDIRWPWRHLAPQLWLRPLRTLASSGDLLEPPWPRLLIACGRNAAAPARAVKRARGGRTFWVQIQDPRFARAEADLVVAPHHDPAPGSNVFRTLGAVHRVTPAKLAAAAARFAPVFAPLPRPLVAVLIGGNNRVYRVGEARFAALCDQLAALAHAGFGLVVTASRRTGPKKLGILRARLAGLSASSGTAAARIPISRCWAPPTRSSSPPIRYRW